MEFPEILNQKIVKRSNENELRKLDISNEFIDFYSNDYLGFAKNKTIYKQVNQYLKSNHFNQNGATGSRLISGNLEIYESIETEIANIHQVEKALIYANGYTANLGLISAIAVKDTIFLYDQYCHASIIDGIRLGLGQYFKFPHLDNNNLEKLLEKHTNKTIFVLTESLFSMDGSIPDLKKMAEICNKYNAYLIVDEAHAIGVLGKNGLGLVQELKLEKEIFVRIVTFGKAMGCHGAAVLGSKKLIEFLVNFSRSFIYSTALTPHAMANIKIAYQYLINNARLIEKLQKNINYFGRFNQNFQPYSPIQSILIGDTIAAKKLALFLQQKNINAKAIVSPTVAKGSERIRICIHQYNTFKEIKLLSNYIKTWKKEYYL